MRIKPLNFLKKRTSKLNNYINYLNNSKFMFGLAMIVVNIGAKYVEVKFTKVQEKYFRYTIGRELLIFSLVFMATHDIIISVIMTASFMILANYVFNENSRFTVLPKKYKELSNAMDTDGDGVVSEEEIENAIKLLTKVKKK